VAVPDIAGTKGGMKSQAVADLPIGARGRPPHHSATAKQYCPSSSAVARQSTFGSVPDTWVTVYTDDIGNTFGPNGFATGSSPQVSSSKYPKS
jgi:hypothetical protein